MRDGRRNGRVRRFHFLEAMLNTGRFRRGVGSLNAFERHAQVPAPTIPPPSVPRLGQPNSSSSRLIKRPDTSASGTPAEILIKSSATRLFRALTKTKFPACLPAIILQQCLAAARVVAQGTAILDQQFAEFLAGKVVHRKYSHYGDRGALSIDYRPSQNNTMITETPPATCMTDSVCS